MNKFNLKEIVEDLIDTFLYAGKVSLELREKGLTKEIKNDNTPVSSGDIEVNRIITKKIIELTPKGVIDRYMKFDEYMNDDKIKQLRTEMYELS